MNGPTFAKSPEEGQWFVSRLPAFQEAQVNKRVGTFFKETYASYFEEFGVVIDEEVYAKSGITLELFTAKIRTEKEDKIYEWFYNASRPYARTSTERLLDLGPTKLGSLRPYQAFMDLYWHQRQLEKVAKADYKKYLATLKKDEKPLSEIQKRSELAIKILAEESDEVKDRVAKHVAAYRDSSLRVMDLTMSVNPEDEDVQERNFKAQDAIDLLPNTLQSILAELEKKTGWSATILVGGPMPNRKGDLAMTVIHNGKTFIDGKQWDQTVPDFPGTVQKSFVEFLQQTYSENMRNRSAILRETRPEPKDDSLTKRKRKRANKKTVRISTGGQRPLGAADNAAAAIGPADSPDKGPAAAAADKENVAPPTATKIPARRALSGTRNHPRPETPTAAVVNGAAGPPASPNVSPSRSAPVTPVSISSGAAASLGADASIVPGAPVIPRAASIPPDPNVDGATSIPPSASINPGTGATPVIPRAASISPDPNVDGATSVIPREPSPDIDIDNGADIPDWALEGLKWLKRNFTGPEWVRLRNAWVRFERSTKWTTPHKRPLSLSNRPHELHFWLKNARRLLDTSIIYKWDVSLDEIPAYELRWALWWNAIMTSLEHADVGGPNGMYMVVISLAFWALAVDRKDAESTDAKRNPVDRTRLSNAYDAVTSALINLREIGSITGEHGSSDEANEDRSKRRRLS